MNWDLYIDKILIVYAHFIIVIGAYYFTKNFIPVTRKDKYYPATLSEKIWIYIAAALIVFFISWLYAHNSITDGAIAFTILSISAFGGIMDALKIDAKLTSDDRRKIKKDIEAADNDSQM
jgi:hypothetical protein